MTRTVSPRDPVDPPGTPGVPGVPGAPGAPGAPGTPAAPRAARRTGPFRTPPPARVLARIVAVVLALDGLAHLVWATGVRWPASDTRTLSFALLGAELPFTALVLLPLAALLLGGAAVVGYRAVLGRRHRFGTLLQIGTLTVATALAIRALAGLVWVLGVGTPPNFPAFYWLNLLVYTPLCLLLATASLLVARDGVERRASVPRRIALGSPVALAGVVLYAAYAWTPAAQAYEPADSVLMKGVESRYLDTDLARFHYTKQGEGPPVVLLSPGTAWVVAWQPQAEKLAADHTVYVVDMPGQGFTDLKGAHRDDFAYDLPAMTGAVDTFLDGVGVTKAAALGGLSWSGGWALAYAQEHPERVDRLLLLASSGADRPDSIDWRIMEPLVLGELVANYGASDRATTAAMVRDMFAHQDRVTEDIVDAMWRPSTFPQNRRATPLLQRGLDWQQTDAAMPDVRQPVLLLWGTEDGTLPAAYANTFTSRIPDTSLQLLKGCGHALTLDCPTQVNKALADFLR